MLRPLLNKRYEVSPERQKELFDPRPGESAEQMIARQIYMARPFELVWLFVLRSKDENQRRAMELAQSTRTAWWTRWAVVIALLTIPVNVTIALVATR